MTPRAHVAIVPVKPPAHGKSRLASMTPDGRRELAEAFALDTVAAASGASSVEQVLVVTDDFRFAADLALLGCAVIPDGVSGDLNGTLVQAAAEARRRWPGLRPVALCADLPALRPGELDAALEDADGDGVWFVADRVGSGTTLYTAPYDDFAPFFGPGSREAHLASGAREVPGDLPSLRQDVDDEADLGRAMLLGVGERTARATGR